MDIKKIIFGAVILVILYIFYTTVFSDKSKSSLTKMHSALDNEDTIQHSRLYGSGSTDYTYSFWIYINDYNKNYGEKKMILERKYSQSGTDTYYFPQIYLGENQNDIHFKISKSNTAGTVVSPSVADCGKKNMDFDNQKNKCVIRQHEIVVHNIPLQKWNHVIMTKSGSTIDIYIDGKLVKTSIMDGSAYRPNPDTGITLTGKINETNGSAGFAGYLSKVLYQAGAVNTREAYQMYKEGYGDGGIGSFFNRFKLKFAFLQDNQEKSSIIL
tara:strand:+ start:2787 stop:3596 length:810 start_codon:yes stop_codon:yes gene_type:complete